MEMHENTSLQHSSILWELNEILAEAVWETETETEGKRENILSDHNNPFSPHGDAERLDLILYF